MANEIASHRARLFPTTHQRLVIRGAKAKPKMTIAEVVEDVEKKARLFERSVAAGKLITK